MPSEPGGKLELTSDNVHTKGHKTEIRNDKRDNIKGDQIFNFKQHNSSGKYIFVPWLCFIIPTWTVQLITLMEHRKITCTWLEGPTSGSHLIIVCGCINAASEPIPFFLQNLGKRYPSLSLTKFAKTTTNLLPKIVIYFCWKKTNPLYYIFAEKNIPFLLHFFFKKKKHIPWNGTPTVQLI